MNDEHAQFERMLDDYLANEMTGESKRTFEFMLESRPELRRKLELQREIDRSLLKTCEAPAELADRAVMAAVASDECKTRPSARPNKWMRRLAIAAMLLLGVYGAWSTWSFLKPVPTGYAKAQAWRAPMAVYEDTVDAGFKPAWVCKDDEEFIRTVRNSLGQRLAVADEDKSVRVVGIAYSNTLSTFTLLILAMVDEQPVIVFADKLSKDRQLPPPPSDSMSWNRRELGNLVLYELSPLPDARVLPLIVIPPKLSDDSCEPEEFGPTTVVKPLPHETP